MGSRNLDEGLETKFEELAHEVIAAAIEVHRLLDPGLPELVYKKASLFAFFAASHSGLCAMHFLSQTLPLGMDLPRIG